MKPLISIIIPVYNHAHTLRRTIECVFRQTYRPLEVIVVNDGSTDNFTDVVDDCFAMIEKECIDQGSMLSIISQENSGAPAARNKGFAASKGEYVIFWDADTVAEPVMIQRLYETLEQNPRAAYAYCKFKFGWKVMQSQQFDAEKLKQVNYIDTTSLIRRSVLSAAPWDESLRRFQDWDLWLSLLAHGQTGVFVPEVLYQKIVAGRLGISKWLPSIMFKLPWKMRAVKEYERAKQSIIKKHNLPVC